MRSLASYRKPCSNMSMGMELECLVHDDQDINRHTHYGFWYATHDISIVTDRAGQHAFEFVSQPLTKAWLIKEIRRLAKNVSWEVNTSCGIHIHVSRKWLSNKNAARLMLFYQNMPDNLREDLFGRPSNRYCQPAPGCRYAAVNTENKDTIEFRMFSSGNAEWAIYCVNMVDWLVRNAKHLNIDAAYAAHDLFIQPTA